MAGISFAALGLICLSAATAAAGDSYLRPLLSTRLPAPLIGAAAPNAKAIAILLHGCAFSRDVWNMPGEQVLVKHLLARGMSVVAMSSRQARQAGRGCWVTKDQEVDSDLGDLLAVSTVLWEGGVGGLGNLLRGSPQVWVGSSSGGFMASMLLSRSPVAARTRAAALYVSTIHPAMPRQVRYPALAFVHMPRDQRTAGRVRTDLSSLVPHASACSSPDGSKGCFVAPSGSRGPPGLRGAGVTPAILGPAQLATVAGAERGYRASSVVSAVELQAHGFPVSASLLRRLCPATWGAAPAAAAARLLSLLQVSEADEAADKVVIRCQAGDASRASQLVTKQDLRDPCAWLDRAARAARKAAAGSRPSGNALLLQVLAPSVTSSGVDGGIVLASGSAAADLEAAGASGPWVVPLAKPRAPAFQRRLNDACAQARASFTVPKHPVLSGEDAACEEVSQVFNAAFGMHAFTPARAVEVADFLQQAIDVDCSTCG